MSNIFTIDSISQVHSMLGCEPPKHPSITFLRFSEMNIPEDAVFERANVNFYIISLKSAKGKMRYGRHYYDFEAGTLLFSSPNQVLYPDHLLNDFQDEAGWSLIFHPDLLFGTDLGNKIHQYHYFSYEVHEALHLSESEQQKINDCISNIVEEYSQNLDGHSRELIVSNLELLLNYCKRFYKRQFLTRTKQNKGVVTQIEKLLTAYFDSEKPAVLGLPSVKYCAQQVNLSPNYLSDLLKKETGKNTKEHIDYYLVNKAKKMLLSTSLTINEIAYDLGFEQPKSFSKLFKKKEGISPNAFRKIN
ncbi:helix-turn-helix domain-containing protein [Tamlana sp. 2201CG12-4]|uniref:helix-turn-helix domain-containing protein n=1 Tax=Tamlana sp. 2201CG12-4 TaxID=3112582 RepID=UPI002DC045CE|nr:helix-turn-helix domain-containing protein [Tamlana sp. 2201CG12-4]MEC3908113.1 helix-turn-helix domain-containing protein [Tamlana sp. 2201CG12-4]